MNSVISDARKGERLMGCDLEGIFLVTPMQNPEDMRLLYDYNLRK